MRYIISYDISDNQLRNRLVRILEKYGERVQYSVFEAELTKDQLRNLIAELKVMIFPMLNKRSKVFIYPLKPHLVPQIKRIGHMVLLDKRFFVV